MYFFSGLGRAIPTTCGMPRKSSTRSKAHRVQLNARKRGSTFVVGHVALGTELNGKYTWWVGRVQQMYRKSSGKTGRYVQFHDSILWTVAVESKVKVVCNWYKQQANYVFTYNGPVDTQQYSLEHALALVYFELPDEKFRHYKLMDPSQGPRLDEALQLMKPSKKSGSKRTRGEEQLAAKAMRERQYTVLPPPDL